MDKAIVAAREDHAMTPAGTQHQYPHLAAKCRIDIEPATNALAWLARRET